MPITESIVEQAALDWLGEQGYEIVSGLAIAPAETAAERSDYKQTRLSPAERSVRGAAKKQFPININ
jgi:hypothetical protein